MRTMGPEWVPANESVAGCLVLPRGAGCQLPADVNCPNTCGPAIVNFLRQGLGLSLIRRRLVHDLSDAAKIKQEADSMDQLPPWQALPSELQPELAGAGPLLPAPQPLQSQAQRPVHWPVEEIRPTQKLSEHEEDGWQQDQQQAGMAAAAAPRAPRALYMRRSSDVQPGLGGAAEAAKGDFSIYITGLPPTSTVTSVASFFRWGGMGWDRGR